MVRTRFAFLACAATAVPLAAGLTQPAQATVSITYVGEQSGVGAAATAHGSSFLDNGYALFNTGTVGTTAGTYAYGGFKTGTQINSLPTYVTSITAPTGGGSFGQSLSTSNYGYSTLDNPTSLTGGTIQAGEQNTFANNGTTMETIITINLGSAVPTAFDLNVITGTQSTADGGTPTELSVAIGAVTGGTQLPAQDVNVDLYTYEITGAAADSSIVISAANSTYHASAYKPAISGVLFSSVPEPTTLALVAVGGLMLLVRRSKRRTGV